jgi:hypothetical protein
VAFKPKKKPAKAAPKPAPRKRPAERVASEHRVAIAGIALAVGYGRDRTERMELRGTATVNANAAGGGTRTTGFVAPASLNRNLAFTLYVDEADLDLLRAVFVTGTGPESADPALVFWARTVDPLDTAEAVTEPVTEFGFRLDFAPGS